ncbi:MAG TPA: alpha-L-arabinofuranosidase C-terminal domain-containing protein [Chloroflexota bacterium]
MARIKIDLDRRLGHVDRRIFGQFIEHLGRCIYGGIFDEGSTLADVRGFRTDVLKAAQALKPPLLRWPGGNFVSGYHWSDGVGPRDERPRKIELAWGSEESNRFGTDEFIAYCSALDTEPYICVNMGSGTFDEAQAWVEYCNGTGNTYWANRRRANGHPEPYGVKLWGLGNEMYGTWQIGALEAQDYVKKARQFAAVMKHTDPTIDLVSCGQWGFGEWDRIVLEGLAPMVRYHSVHLYTGAGDFYRNVFMPHQADRALRICEATIERVRYEQRIEHPIGIAYDEWNVWYRTRDAAGRAGGLEEQYDLADALAVATFLNVFVRHCRSVEIANLAQMVNVIAPIFTRPEGIVLQTIYHPLRLYAEHLQSVALDAFVDSPTMNLPIEGVEDRDRAWNVADLGPFSLLDVVATCDAAGAELCLAVVNRSRDQPITASIDVAGRGLHGWKAFVVDGPEPSSRNSFEQPDVVSVHEQAMSPPEVEFAPHSVTVLRGRL